MIDNNLQYIIVNVGLFRMSCEVNYVKVRN